MGAGHTLVVLEFDERDERSAPAGNHLIGNRERSDETLAASRVARPPKRHSRHARRGSSVICAICLFVWVAVARVLHEVTALHATTRSSERGEQTRGFTWNAIATNVPGHHALPAPYGANISCKRRKTARTVCGSSWPSELSRRSASTVRS